MSQEWPSPAPQHAEHAPAAPTKTAGEETIARKKPARVGLVPRMWGGALTWPAPSGRGRAPGQLSPALQLFLWRPRRPD